MLTLAALLLKHMRIPLTVNNANKMPVMHSQFSKMMVNVRNVVTTSNLKRTTPNVKLQSLYAQEPVNGWVMMVHAKLVKISLRSQLIKNLAQIQTVWLIKIVKHQLQLMELVLQIMHAQAGPN